MLTVLMALVSAEMTSVPLPAGAITLSGGGFDSSFCFGLDGPQSNCDPTHNPHEGFGFKPSPAWPGTTLEQFQPWLPSPAFTFHPLMSPILCPDGLFKSLPPLLMLVSDGELVYKNNSKSFGF